MTGKYHVGGVLTRLAAYSLDTALGTWFASFLIFGFPT